MSVESRDALDAIRDCDVPVIAYLNGDAIGGGAELALACDMRVMAATARIGYIQAKLAIPPAWGGGTDLCVLIGSSRARSEERSDGKERVSTCRLRWSQYN